MSFIRPAAVLVVPLALAGSHTASAGGLGVMASGGVHTGRAYYYNDVGKQGFDSQTRPNAGVGAELVLGDKDDKIEGLVRMYWLGEAPLTEPDAGGLTNVQFPLPETEWRDVGVFTTGVQWGVLGSPDGAQLTITTLIGGGFWTSDNTEFLMVEAAPGGSYTMGERVQFYANLATTARYRKHLWFGENLYAGVRYQFD